MKNVKKTVDLDKMTPAQSRVAIAKDVIESLLAERFKATTGTYIYSPGTIYQPNSVFLFREVAMPSILDKS